MIDIQNIIFDRVYTACKNSNASIECVSDYVAVPKKFPCVTFMEISNAVNKRYMTANSLENVVNVSYEINIYSNLKNGRKTQANGIAEVVDQTMVESGFIRNMRAYTPNIDNSVLRMTLRYSAKVSYGSNNNTYKISQ